MPFAGLRPYVQLARGLPGATAARALHTARDMLPEELVATGRNGRDVLVGLVRAEVDRAVGRLGLLPGDALDELRAELATAQARLGHLEHLVSELAARPGKTAGSTRTVRTPAPPRARPRAAGAGDQR